LPFGIQLAVWLRFQNRASDALDWLTARFDFADVFSKMFQLTADANFSAPYLKAQHAEAQAALEGLHKLHRLVRIAELRQQGLLHALINPLFLWDLNCALRLNAWKRHYAHQAPAWFETTATLEALCALGSYAFTEPHATFPTIEEEEGTWQAHALGHPLLAPDIRVSNDVSLLGPKSLMIITGSNMAGKSTLLRAVGINTALALAGGPVCASHMRLSLCRLRASMRIQDSLQTGASYFHAELQRLDATLADAAQKPPVFFLLDELLRGTNAQARHEASRAVLIHLLERGAFGIIATHDTELTELAKEQPGHIVNVHFTDVMVGQEMHFDYMLQKGPVRSSNAVPLVTRLLMRHA
jgi:DNA mismatch repair ATPase MutS